MGALRVVAVGAGALMEPRLQRSTESRVGRCPWAHAQGCWLDHPYGVGHGATRRSIRYCVDRCSSVHARRCHRGCGLKNARGVAPRGRRGAADRCAGHARRPSKGGAPWLVLVRSRSRFPRPQYRCRGCRRRGARRGKCLKTWRKMILEICDWPSMASWRVIEGQFGEANSVTDGKYPWLAPLETLQCRLLSIR